MIRFSCPGCNAVYTVADEKGGKTGACPKCQSRFQIPMPEGGAAAPPPPPVDVFARTSPPPPPPPPPANTGTVELACPSCNGALAVNASDLGSDVQCPYCNKVFTAARPGGSSTAKPQRTLDDVLGGGTKRSRAEDDEDRPSRRRSRADDDEDEEDERPRRRSRARADDDEDEEERPRKKKKRRRDYEPHRGTLILVLGILGLVGCSIFTAIPAWLMGKADLEKMDRGAMDPEGRSLTNVGRILGMVSTILTSLGLAFYCVIVAIAIAAGGAAGR